MMVRKKSFSYFIKNKKGGILLSVLGLLSLVSLVALLVFDSQSLTVETTLETRDYYLAKTLEIQALKYSEIMGKEEVKRINFNKGVVELEENQRNKKIKVKTSLKNGYQLINYLPIE